MSPQTTINPHLLIAEAESALVEQARRIEQIAFTNQRRVLDAFRKHRLTEEYFAEKTGYGLNDHARDVIDKIFADALQAEACAVRLQLVSGTHALACALIGNLAPGQRLASITGRPYDTLEQVIGIKENVPGSLKSLNVDYIEGHADPLLDDEKLEQALSSLVKPPTTIAYIQKSCGYAFGRRTLANKDIARLAKITKQINPKCQVLVDNCYGEFVEDQEPTASGADLMAGSLIKNPGAGLALTGGYIAGKEELVERALNRLTAPGIGGHLGLTYNQNRLILQGLFLAPGIVAQAVRGACLVAAVMEKLGIEVSPGPLEMRYDIIQGLKLGTPDKLVNFCRALQHFSPVNAHVMPEASEMPGYEHKVVMAGGTFIAGSTIELSADGPLRPPYAAYVQGGLSYLHVKCALAGALELSAGGQFPFL